MRSMRSPRPPWTLPKRCACTSTRHWRSRRQVTRSAGAVALGNLAIGYSDLGLYPHARRLQAETVALARGTGARLSLAYGLGNLLDIERHLGELDAARRHSKEFAELVPALGDPTMDASHLLILGDLAMAEGDAAAATRHYRSCVRRIRLTGSSAGENIALTKIAEACLANNDAAAALRASTRATALHRAQSFAQPDGITSQEIWCRHAQALTANRKGKEAREALDRAYDFLVQSMANLRDEGLRRNYLNKVGVNREIVAAWLADGAKRRLPRERLLAHLAIESNVREPFQRLADTGLRLNALHTVAEIQTFLVEEATEFCGGERVLLILDNDGKRKVAESIVPVGEDVRKLVRSIESHLAGARLSRTAQLQYTPRTGPAHRQRSRVVAPLIAQNRLLGYLYADMDGFYGRFTETDRDMMGMLANQAAVALDNAQWAQGLERKVEQRTAELNQRVGELEIINAIQRGLAAELDFQGIVDMVGDKLREVHADRRTSGSAGTTSETRLAQPLYVYEHGKRLFHPPALACDPAARANACSQTRQPVVLNATAELLAIAGAAIPGTDMAKCAVWVPIIGSDRVLGAVQLENHEREYAYGESEVRLLQTVAASMGVALENARLFDETQRLLKETEQRNAELAIINSVQAALAAELNIQGIYDAVGDKIREIFGNADIGIRIYDPKSDLIHYPYTYESGKRIAIDSEALGDKGVGSHVIRTRETVVVNANMAEAMEKYESYLMPGTLMPRSSVYVPLVAGDQARGVIDLSNYERENAYSDSDVRLLQTLANSMSVALENARLFDETQRLLKETDARAAELAIINGVQQGLADKLEAQAIYELVGDKLRELFDSQAISIVSFDAERNNRHYHYLLERGQRFEMPDGPIAPLGWHLIRTGKPLLVNDNLVARLSAVGIVSKTLPGTEPTKCLVRVPILAGDRVIGVIGLDNMDRENAFGDDDVRLLSTLAGSMSVALEGARLFEQTKLLLAQTEQRAGELATINSVGQALAARIDLGELIHMVGERMRETFHADIVYVALLDDAGQMIHFPYVYGDELAPLALGEGLTGKIIETGKALLINEGMDDTSSTIGATPVGLDAKSYLGVPIVVRGKAIGVISVQSTQQEGRFAAADQNLLATIATGVGVAIRNAQLYKEAKEARAAAEGRERGQELVPRHDEPRDPHADERGDRDERTPARHAAQCRATRLRDDDPRLGRRAAHHHQRHPRLLEDRSRAHGHRGAPVRPARVRGIGARPRQRARRRRSTSTSPTCSRATFPLRSTAT